MPLKFRLNGLAETFVEDLVCPRCDYDGGEAKDEGFDTTCTRVTFGGIVVVCECFACAHVFLPKNQKIGIINSRKLRGAVEKDSIDSGEPYAETIEDVRLSIELLNAEREDQLQ